MAPDADATGDGEEDDDGGNGTAGSHVPPPSSRSPRSPREALLVALSVRRYARLALAVGAAVALGVLVLFPVALAGGRPTRPVPLYLALAFVVFVTTSLLAAVVLVGRRVLRLAVHPASIVRHAGTVGLVDGAVWLVAAVALPLGPAPPWGGIVDVAVPWAALLTPVGLWAAYTRYKRAGAGRVAAVAALVGLAGALVVADLAAFDLLALLPDVGGGVDEATARLFVVGLLALVGGHVVLAAVAVAGGAGPGVPLALGGPPLVGLAAYLATGPGRLGLGALAAGFGCCWLVVGWRLRGMPDAAVPTGPPIEFGVD